MKDDEGNMVSGLVSESRRMLRGGTMPGMELIPELIL